MSAARPDAPEQERLSALLLDAEQRAGSVPELRRQIAELEQALQDERDRADACDRRADDYRGRLTETTETLVKLKRSRSWQLTKGLRAVARLTR